MHFAFTEEQEELRAMARSFVADHSTSEQVRHAMESEPGYDDGVWKRIGSELGWPAVIVPEAYGGLGLSYVELVALMEIVGESLLCSPFFSSVALGANALLVAGTEEQKRQWLPQIAEGQVTATLAYAESGSPSLDCLATEAEAFGDEFVLRGTKRFVVDGHSAELLVVAARLEEDVALFLVPGDEPGLSRSRLPTVDQTRRLAEIELNGVCLPGAARLQSPGSGTASLQKILDLAAIALSAEQVGGAQRCLDMAVAYAKEREQFGRPIGSFQAIKHKCADMMVRVESARSASYYAACVAADDGEALGRAASLAKAYCSDAYFHCAAENIQIHGGVGFTWEYDAHLYFKRAKSSESLLGNANQHRERIAQALEL